MKRPDMRRKLYILSGCVLLASAVILLHRPLVYAVKILAVSGSIALLTSPLCRIFEKKFGKGAAAALTLLTAVILCILIFSAVLVPLTSAVSGLYRRALPYFSKNLSQMRFGDIGNSKEMLTSVVGFAGNISSGAVGAAGTVADALVSIAVAWHLLVSRQSIALYAELAIPSAFRQQIIAKVAEMKIELGMYLRGQVIIAFCVGMLSAIGLKTVGIPYGIMLGITAGVLNMIPYLGPVIACLPVGLLALSEGIIPAVLGIGVLIAVQQIDGLILSPRIVGSSTGFSPGLVLIAIFASGAVWGIAGMLLAMPGLILIRTCVRVFVELGRNY